MISQYKNIDTNVLKQPVVAQRFNDKDLSLLSYARNGRVALDSNVFNGSNFRTELHIYAADEWITGNHAINTNRKTLTNVLDVVSNKTRSLYNKTIEVDLYSEFEKLNLTRGEFTVVLNFFKNILGSYENQYIRVAEISPDRTEIRLEIIDDNNPEFLTQITRFIQNVIPQQKNPNSRFYTYLLNFSRNKTATFINSVVTGTDGNTQIYLKLYEPLDASIEEKDKCWLVQEDKQPYVDQVVIRPEVVEINTINKLSGPNWEANTSLHTSAETNLKNWNELLGSSIPTSQQIINAYFSGSIIGDELNIDFSDFNNFIFYSSATERIKNFKYKIELLEFYNQQYSISLNTSGSIAQNNAAQYQTNIDNLIGGFDNFERYLYYDSSSALFTHNVPLENANVANITGSYVQPWPKSNSTKPYTLYSATSSIAESWYNGILDSASIYDVFNPNSLQKTIPEYIRINEDNEQLDLFVAILGHHYDIIYTYINHVSRIHKRDEHPKLSMPDELLYSVAKQFGWTLNEGNQYTDLWQYVLGTNESGTFLTGSNSVNNDSISSKKMTRHVWRRIVNNLPHLLKTKGTKRSIKALLSCYGIPQSMISINEYGGPRLERPPVYEKLNFDYALDLIQNTAGTVTVDYDQPINSVELRFRTDNVLTNPALPSTMNLFSFGYMSPSFDSNNTASLHGGSFPTFDAATISIDGSASIDIDTRVDNVTLYLDESTFAISQSYQLDYEVTASETGAEATLTFGYTDNVNVSGSFPTSKATYADPITFQIGNSFIDTNAINPEIFTTISDGGAQTGIFTSEGNPVDSANISWSLNESTYTITLLDGIILDDSLMDAEEPPTLNFPSTTETQYIGSTGITASAGIFTKPYDNFGTLAISRRASADLAGTYNIVSIESTTNLTIDTALSDSGSGVDASLVTFDYINTGSYSTGTVSVVSASQTFTYSNNVTIDFTRGTLGTIQINGTSSADIEMFDGGWLNVLLRSGSNGSLEVVAKKSKYGKIVAAVSASATSSFAGSGTLTLGGTGGGSRLQGQLQELRLWSSSLQDTPFNNHTKAPAAYDGNVDAYDELVFRLPLTQKINHTVTSSLQGVEPNVSGISASFSGWSTSQPYDSIEETYYYDGISLAAGTFDDNKVRIENNDLIGVLNTKTRAERSQFDTAPLDSKKLGVYFSPQTMINEDIIAQFGFTELDSYIGDPSKIKEKSYTDLIQIAQSYWKKYETKNDINSYIKIFTLFDLSFFKQLEQLLPARVERNTGLLIQPNILERSKDVSMLEISRENVTYETDIVNIPPTADTEYQFYTASIQSVNAITSSYDPEKLGVILRKSNKYESMIYNYQYLFFQNGLPVTGSSPYWLSEATLPIYSSSINTVNDISLGSKRHRYIGSKMSSTDFNVDSNQTIDGGPVVEIINTNPNQLIYTQQGNNGNFRIS